MTTQQTNITNMMGKEIAVIGAGIIGVNCALELQSLGFQVTLIDKNDIGEGCSKSNAGHFATEQVFPLAEPSLLWQLPKLLLDPLGPMALSPRYFPKALPWFVKFIHNMFASKRTKNSHAIKSLNLHAIDYYKPLLKAANAEHLLTEKGSLLVYEDTAVRRIEQLYRHYKEASVPVMQLNRAQTLLLEPNLSKKINGSLYFTDVAHTVNPLQICQALAKLAIDKGCIFKKCHISHLSHNDENISLTTKNETLVFDQVVIAAGAWSKALLKPLGYKLPIEAERGYSFDLPPSEKNQTLTRPVASVERKFIITPMGHGLRLSGTVEFSGLEEDANYKRANSLYKNAGHILASLPQVNLQKHSSENKWMGHRPSLPDSLPVIGQAPKHKNVFLALGHQHLGLTQGAITGKLIGQVLTNQPTDIEIKPFCISRFN
jgi:D-amino-acid dehydrogenase